MRVVAFLVFALLASVVNASSSCEADLNGDGICDPYGVRPLEDDSTISRITIDIGGVKSQFRDFLNLETVGCL